jgi:hypothetical protein
MDGLETFLTLFGEMGFSSEKMRDIIPCHIFDTEGILLTTSA